MQLIAYILATLKSINENLMAGTNTSVVLTIGVTTIVSIMAVALPILTNAIVNLDSRYKSTYVVDIFKERWSVWLFIGSLAAAICAVLLWTLAYYFFHNILYISTIILFFLTILVVIFTFYLICDVVRFSIPSSLLEILKTNIGNVRLPKGYYNRRPTKEEINANEDFDKETKKYFGVLASLYIDSIQKRDHQSQDIIKYWEKIVKADESPNEENYDVLTLSYPNCYFHFIREVERWAFMTGERTVRNKEIVALWDKLLNGNLGSQNGKVILEYSFETLDHLWKSMRDVIDNNKDEMFKYFWFVVNNAYMRRETRSGVPSTLKEDIHYGQLVFARRAFLCCAYLLAKKKYDLLEYAVNYSMSVPFSRPMLPNTVDEVLENYIFWRRWNNDFEKSTYLHFNDDLSTTSIVENKNILTAFGAFMMHVIFIGKAGEKKRFLDGEMHAEAYSQAEFKQYVEDLIHSYAFIPYEWMRHFDFSKPTITKIKIESIITCMIEEYEGRQSEKLKKHHLFNSKTNCLNNTTRVESERFWMDFLHQWPNNYDGTKNKNYTSQSEELKFDKKHFVYGFCDDSKFESISQTPALVYRYELVTQLRNYFIAHTQTRIETLYPEEATWNELIAQIKTEHPLYDSENVFREAQIRAMSTMGKQLRDVILHKYLGTTPFTCQMAIVSFMPSLKELLSIKDTAHYFEGIQIIDILSQYRGTEANNKRFQKYIYNSIFIVRKSDLPYLKIRKNEPPIDGYKLVSKELPLYMRIKENDDMLSVNTDVYIPYDLYWNNKQFKQIIIKFKPLEEENT